MDGEYICVNVYRFASLNTAFEMCGHISTLVFLMDIVAVYIVPSI